MSVVGVRYDVASGNAVKIIVSTESKTKITMGLGEIIFMQSE